MRSHRQIVNGAWLGGLMVLAWVAGTTLAFAESAQGWIKNVRGEAEAKYGKTEVPDVPKIYFAPTPLSVEEKRGIETKRASEKFERHLFDEALRAGGRDVPR